MSKNEPTVTIANAIHSFAAMLMRIMSASPTPSPMSVGNGVALAEAAAASGSLASSIDPNTLPTCVGRLPSAASVAVAAPGSVSLSPPPHQLHRSASAPSAGPSAPLRPVSSPDESGSLSRNSGWSVRCLR